MNKSSFYFLLLFLFYSCFSISQNLPDSLLRRVVIFKKMVYGSDMNFQRELGLPEATGFYIKSDSISQLYIATAKHILIRKDTIKTTHVHYRHWTKDGNEEDVTFILSPEFKNSASKKFSSDKLIDLLILDQSLPVGAASRLPQVHGFSPNEIMNKNEFESIKKGQEIFYIGMYPDSVHTENNYYWIVQGIVDTVFIKPVVVEDKRLGFKLKVDYALKAIGKPGVSGSPVILQMGGQYKLFGIINAISIVNNNIFMLGTASYRINEILKK